MDDDCRNKKPQQKIYTPGCGPLRKSVNMESMDSNLGTNPSDVSKGRGQGRERSKQYSNDSFGDINENVSRRREHANVGYETRCRKPSQRVFTSKSPRRSEKPKTELDDRQQSENRNYGSLSARRNNDKFTRDHNQHNGRNPRQYSEPRTVSPFRSNQDNNYHNRNWDRDSKSMEPSMYRQGHPSGGKPPSGRRNSGGNAESKSLKFIPANLENLPPRLRKKYLADTAGQHDNNAENKLNEEMLPSQKSLVQPVFQQQRNPSNVWSQTLPSRGRGRLKDPNFDHEKYIANFKRNFDSFHSTPSSSSQNLHDLSRECTGDRSVPWRRTSQTVDGEPFRGQPCNDYILKGDAIVSSQAVRSSIQDGSKQTSTRNIQSETSKKTMSTDYKNEGKSGHCSSSKNSLKDEESIPTTELNSLDWTEEVEKNIKLDKLTILSMDSKESTPAHITKNAASAAPDNKTQFDQHKIQKRPGRHRNNRDKRSSSQNKRERSTEQSKPSPQQKPELVRRNSAQESTSNLRERRDSHRSNRSSHFGSREDIDKWRSWRSYSREHSLERKVVSQSNSREPSMNRAASPRDDGGFKVPEGRTTKKSRKRRVRSNNQPTPAPVTNWREEIIQKEQCNERKPSNQTTSGPPPGVLVIPSEHRSENPASQTFAPQRTLFDPQNPSQPIIIQASVAPVRDTKSENAVYGEAGNAEAVLALNRAAPALIRDWSTLRGHRKTLQNTLRRLLLTDMKHCQSDNIEHHYWKILYYNFIEILRKSLIASECQDRDKILEMIVEIIDEGTEYFEDLIELIEKTYKFKVEDFLSKNYSAPPKGLKYVGLALISIQKLYIFLGDLARYKEQVKETNNYGRSKLWYTKAQQINPKNGRPYNQLAILAVYARRKLDAVYFYMRSLMSSNPFQSARESLISLFDENRKKFEAADRRRIGARAASKSVCGGALRREVWLRPGGTRTTSLHHQADDSEHDDEERLQAMSSVELNKSFITSYLHVHGKLVTKIGMETFSESSTLMLRQFRALLRQQPLPTTSHRLLQLTALNMFAIETCSAPSQKDSFSDKEKSDERTPWLDCALSVALLMFGIMLERACVLLPESSGFQGNTDAMLILPAIKVWCDWMLCHSRIWNPPPSLESFNLGRDSDPWDCLAKFMNILETLKDSSIEFESGPKEGYDPVRLEEDIAMAGFTPLMYMELQPAWAPRGLDLELALRVRRLLFFGSEYLCGTEPPVLRPIYSPDHPPALVSAVRPRRPPAGDVLTPVLRDEDQLHDVSEDDETEETSKVDESEPASGVADEATRRLLRRRTKLEQRRQLMERRRQRMQEIVQSGFVSVEMEVRPRWLVPDTNCFIDHLTLLQKAAAAAPYTLAVPIVVVSELEGLRRCDRVGDAARAALTWLTDGALPANVKFATSRGSLLLNASFTAETRDYLASNDDRVLSTAVSLHAAQTQQHSQEEQPSDGTRRLVRSVVLLTDDRNLRVKALAADLPARDLPAFCTWAALS